MVFVRSCKGTGRDCTLLKVCNTYTFIAGMPFQHLCNGKEGRKMEKVKKFFDQCIVLIFVFAAIMLLVMAFREQYPLWKNQKGLEQLRSDVGLKQKDKDPIDWKKLKTINPDIVGWIKVSGTKIDYPILRGKEWNEYLHKDYKGKDSYAGSIFIQPETSFTDRHLVIYGHNMRVKSMFGSLHEFESKDFYKKHNKIYLYQPGEKIKCTIYSVYDCLDKSDTFLTNFVDNKNNRENKWGDWLSMTIEKNAYYPIKNTPTKEDNVITLSTCSGKKKGDDYRFVVHGMITKTVVYDQ